MLTGLDHSELLADNIRLGPWRPADSACQEMTHLALGHAEPAHLAAEMFETFRKLSGQDTATHYLGAVQTLAGGGTVAGARLLAAFLNVATPGERLLPMIQRLDAARRYSDSLRKAPGGLGPFQGDWLQRAERLQVKARLWAADHDLVPDAVRDDNPRWRHPWPLLRAVLDDLVSRAKEDGFDGPADGVDLLGALLRLEIDAKQERTSQLAGSVHPFKVEAVARVLPLLNKADSAIRDMRHMAGAAAEADFETAFLRPQARWRETLDDKDWNHLLRDLRGRPELAPLARLAAGLAERPVPVPQLAHGISRIIALSRALVDEGVRDEPFDLLTACVLVQTHYGNGQAVFTVDPELGEALTVALPAAGEPAATGPLAGISHMSGLLVVEMSETGSDLAKAYPDGLPVQREMDATEDLALCTWRQEHKKLDPDDVEAMRAEALAIARLTADEDDEEEVVDMDIAALKHLVLTNIQSVSVLLGFLRNPKVFSIPGLVEDVVNRTRNPQIVETICTDRALHTGFANKGVALACLRSPVNVSVKVLRKFCHVKYVSKVDLKRLAADRTGIRKEVGREIARYLEALA